MNDKVKGITLAGLGGSLWGVSGILAQLLFNEFHASSEWLVSIRLVFAGILILLYSALIKREKVFDIIKNKADLLQLIAFAVLGMVGVQYLFFKTIETSSASLATILQFTAPIFVYLWLLITREKTFNLGEFSLVLLTFLGVFLIVTNGSFTSISVSTLGLITGIGSAIAVAFYTLQPRKILAKYGSPIVVGWGMLIGGFVFQFISPLWEPNFELNLYALVVLLSIIVFGTAVAFLSYLSSVQYIDPSLASIMTALEPLLAAVLSVFVFSQAFGIFEIIGIIIVLVSVLLLSNYDSRLLRKQKKAQIIKK